MVEPFIFLTVLSTEIIKQNGGNSPM
jgi:hypothetical protein